MRPGSSPLSLMCGRCALFPKSCHLMNHTIIMHHGFVDENVCFVQHKYLSCIPAFVTLFQRFSIFQFSRILKAGEQPGCPGL